MLSRTLLAIALGWGLGSAPAHRAQTPQAELRSLAKDISCKATRCILKNGVVDRVLKNLPLVTNSVRIVPVAEDGKVTSIKLLAIRPGSLWTLLGLRNGDQVRSINEYEIASPEKALQAYAALRAASELQVLLTRAGAPLTLTYVIKP